jgi:hypothetical protein
LALLSVVTAEKRPVELSADFILNPTADPWIHTTPHLLNIALHGHSLSENQKESLRELGYSFTGELVNHTSITRWEADGLDQFTDSGMFRFHYTTDGTHSVGSEDLNGNSIPDYVDSMVTIFSNVHTNQLLDMNYVQPPSDGSGGGSDHYDIYIRNLQAGYYGYVQAENFASGNGDNENSEGTEMLAVTSYMAMRNDYDGFPSNTPIENIQVTAAHEFFHAIQFGYNAYEKPWLMEATAVWMEEQVYDSINDCYQYLPSWFAYPQTSLNAGGTHWYGSFIFFQYIEEHMGGSSAMQRIFEIGVSQPSDETDFSQSNIDQALVEQGFSFIEALNGMAIANLLLTSDSETSDYTYSEAEDYPISEPGIYRTVSFIKGFESSVTSTSLNKYATQYIKLESDNPMKVVLSSVSTYTADFQMNAILQNNTGLITIFSGNEVNIDPTGMIAMTLAIVSQDTVGGDWDYSISITDGIPSVIGEPLLPGEIKIESNYPNPFNGTTSFQINIAETQQMEVEIVNSIGQTVRTILEGNVEAGGTPLTWDGRMETGERAPSGLYFVNAIGQSTTTSEKILYLK